jgi:hypothetical protein
MKTRIIRIGNSQGFRIPKLYLEQSGLGEEVQLEVQAGEIIIRSTQNLGRDGLKPFPYWPNVATTVCSIQTRRARRAGMRQNGILDQIRSVDKIRLIKKLGKVDSRNKPRFSPS